MNLVTWDKSCSVASLGPGAPDTRKVNAERTTRVRLTWAFSTPV